MLFYMVQRPPVFTRTNTLCPDPTRCRSATGYNYGKFTAFDTHMAAISLSAMSLGVPAFMLSKVLAPAFYARQDMKTPMRAAIITVVANVLLTAGLTRSEEHTSELQSLMRISYAVFCLKQNKQQQLRT